MARAEASRELPPPLEVECLKVLWKLGSGTVRQVLEAMGTRKLAYTTVMTLLDRLEKRGRVDRVKRGRSFVYTPRATQEQMRALAVKEMLDRFFEGNLEGLTQFLKTSSREH
jgi:predicted transcriptional regulator